VIGYKLFRRRDDGTLGSLFIHRQAVVPIGEWLQAEPHRTRGYAFRPGWHVCPRPVAPHLKLRLANGEQRVWYRVEIKDYTVEERPASQGGRWCLAQWMKVLGPVE
jgi:hypothetical protein